MNTQMRFEALKAMNTLMVLMNDEETYYDHWIYIIPDEADDDELMDIAMDEDEEIFKDAVNCFNRCVRDYACKSGYCIEAADGKSCEAYGCIEEPDDDGE